MTKLSVNINKVATIRNARGGQIPNVVKFSQSCEAFGAEGITVHPRPDQRHITYKDIEELLPTIQTEFNIEGNPNQKFIDLVLTNKPTQVTLVPDKNNVLTSDQGWDTATYFEFLKDVVYEFKKNGIRTSIFVDPIPAFIEHAAKIGTDRIELYTKEYADIYPSNKEVAIKRFKTAAEVALDCDLGLNAGHDLNLENLQYFVKYLPNLLEVSIGHALISDALYYGIENTIQLYKSQIELGKI